MTPETLSELKSLLEKATPGKWEGTPENWEGPRPEILFITKLACETVTTEKKNLELICALRNAAPDLIKAVEQRDRYRAELEDIRDGAGIWIPSVAADKALKDTKEETNESENTRAAIISAIQIGDSTHHHDQSILSVNFRVINTMIKTASKLRPLLITLESVICFPD